MTPAAAALLAALAATGDIRLATQGLTGVRVEPKVAAFYTERLANALTARGVPVTTPKQIAAMLDAARQKQLAGCDEVACIAELANALGVDAMLVGDVLALDKGFALEVKVVSPADGSALSVYSGKAASESELLDRISEAAAQIAVDLPPKLGKKAVAQARATRWQLHAQNRSGAPLYAIWGASPNDIWVAGKEGTISRIVDGGWFEGHQAWRPQNAVHGSGPDDVFIVGGNPGYPVFYRWKGGTWDGGSEEPFETGQVGQEESTAMGVWVERRGRAYVVGTRDGWVVRYDQGKWTKLPGLGKERLGAIWGFPDAGLFVAAADGGYKQLADGGWQRAAAGVRLYSVWGATPQEVWFVGEQGRAMKFGEPPIALDGGTLWGVHGTSSKDVWAVGSDGKVWHYDGASWALEAELAATLSAVWTPAPGEVWAVGYDGGGVVFHRR